MKFNAFKYVALTGSVISLACLAGCQSGNAKIPESYLQGTPLDRNPIGVTATTEFLEIDLDPSDTQLRQVDRNRISNFITAYNSRGHGPLVMSMPSAGANQQLAVQAVAEARAIAWENGVEYEEITGKVHDAADNVTAPLILAFQAYEAVAPACKSLASLDLSDVSSNNELPTLGCAIRKNMAAMIADPGDLLGQRPLGPADAARRAIILEKFRAGEPTGATRSDDETGTVSTAVQN